MLAKKPVAQGPTLTAKQAPSTGGLPNPRDTHKSLPADFFSRNYCQELAHNELYAYVPKVKADPSLQSALRNIFTTKAPLGAGHSNAITLWVYAGYALNNLDLDGVESIAFADLSGATITNVIFSDKHYMDIEGVSFVGATMDNVTIMNSLSHLARWGIPQDLQLGDLNRAENYKYGHIAKFHFLRLSPQQTYKIKVQHRIDEIGLNLYQVHKYHTGEHQATLMANGAWDIFFSPDEQLVVTHEQNKKHSFFVHKLSEQRGCNTTREILERKLHFEILPIEKGNYIPTITAFSPDSQKLAVAYVNPDLDSGPVPLLGNMIIRIYNTQTWEVEGETKNALVHKNGIEFFDNDNLMYLSAVDKTGVKNQLNILQRSESTRFNKTKVSWEKFAAIALDNTYAIELQVFPSTKRIAITFDCKDNRDFTKLCFYHVNGKKLKEVNSFPWIVKKHLRKIHPTGKYLVKQLNGPKSDMQIISIDTGAMVHHIQFNWPRCGNHLEFTPDGKGISFIRLREPEIGWYHEEQYLLSIPAEYVLSRVLHTTFEPKFNPRNVKVLIPHHSTYNGGLGFEHCPDQTAASGKYLGLIELGPKKSPAYEINKNHDSPDDTQSSSPSPEHSPPKNGLANQLQQAIKKREEHPKPSAPPLSEEEIKALQKQAEVPPPPVPPKPPQQAMQQMSRDWSQRTSTGSQAKGSDFSATQLIRK